MSAAYKHSDIGTIPNDWDTTPLGAVVEASAPIRYGVVQIGPDTADGVPIVPIKHLKDIGRAALHKAALLLEQRYARSRVVEGDVLLSVKGTIGQVGIAPKGFSGNIAREIARIRVRRGVSPEFIVHQLESGGTQERILRAIVGTTRQEFSIAAVRRFEISLPTEAEQRAIATALSDVDALLGALDRLIAKKRDLKQAAMQQLLTGKTRLPGFSEQWEIKRLDQICEIGMGRTPPRVSAALWGKGHTWLSIADLKGKVVSESREQITAVAVASMQIVPKGTLLMSFKLSIGRLCFAGCDLFTNEAICSFNNLRANAEYLYYQLSTVDFSIYGKQAVKGYTLNKESLKQVEVPLPKPDEQTAIAAVLSDMDAELEALEQRRTKTVALKQGMMQELLTGRTRLV